jgi:hypothetical protein
MKHETNSMKHETNSNPSCDACMPASFNVMSMARWRCMVSCYHQLMCGECAVCRRRAQRSATPMRSATSSSTSSVNLPGGTSRFLLLLPTPSLSLSLSSSSSSLPLCFSPSLPLPLSPFLSMETQTSKMAEGQWQRRRHRRQLRDWHWHILSFSIAFTHAHAHARARTSAGIGQGCLSVQGCLCVHASVGVGGCLQGCMQCGGCLQATIHACVHPCIGEAMKQRATVKQRAKVRKDLLSTQKGLHVRASARGADSGTGECVDVS